MPLADKLLTKPRETSGARSSNRFDFQKDWALTHLLVLHEKGNNYVLLLEHHEDVAAVDCDKNPSNIDCYQVKTMESGCWSLTALLSKKSLKSKKSYSILGKMYGNRGVFDPHTRSLSLVSNVGFKLKLKKGSGTCEGHPLVKVKDLADAHLKTINAALKKEHTLAGDPDFASITHFVLTELSLTDHSTHAQGKLVTFLEKVRPNRVYEVGALYRVLFEEIKRRTNYDKPCPDLATLIERKGISKAFFDKILDDLPERQSFESVWQTISAGLTSGMVPYSKVLGLQRECKQYEVQRMDLSNAVLGRLRKAVEEEAKRLLKDSTNRSLPGLLQAGVAAVKGLGIKGANVFTDTYLEAMFLLTFHEY